MDPVKWDHEVSNSWHSDSFRQLSFSHKVPNIKSHGSFRGTYAADRRSGFTEAIKSATR